MTQIKYLILLECDIKTHYNELFVAYTDSDKLPKFYILVDHDLKYYKDKELKNNFKKDFLISNGLYIHDITNKFMGWYKKSEAEKLQEIRKIKLDLLD